jgi:inorganic pyrophosphatase
MSKNDGRVFDALGVLFQGHPWHGVGLGPRAPQVVTAYIEIVPSDTIKYEIDKVSGLLRVDRPQKYSSICPSLYGLLPKTMCAEKVAERAVIATGRSGLAGDGDPLDICVLTEKVITHGNILVDARPIGGLRMLDGDAVDDKIVAVLDGDEVYGRMRDLSDCPVGLVDRLRHYFLSYKQFPDGSHRDCEIVEVYGQKEAEEVIVAGQADYLERFAGLHDLISAALQPFDQ